MWSEKFSRKGRTPLVKSRHINSAKHQAKASEVSELYFQQWITAN